MLLHYEFDTMDFPRYTWIENWPTPAKVILLQHGVQRGLADHQQAMIRWIEYATVHQKYFFDSKVFLDLLEGHLSKGIKNDLFAEKELRLFWKAAKKILQTNFEFIRKLQKDNPVDDNIEIKQLISILRLENNLLLLNYLSSLITNNFKSCLRFLWQTISPL